MCSQELKPQASRKVEFTVLGQLVSMKNQRFPIFMGKKCPVCKRGYVMTLIKSFKAQAYKKSFLQQIHSPVLMFSETAKIKLTVHAWYKNKRSDLDCEQICDLLQEANIIHNDNQIVHKEYIRMPEDKINPRAKILVEYADEKFPEKMD